MKKIILGAVFFVLTLSLIACSHDGKVNTYAPESLAGYIFIGNNEIVLDEVEIITREDKDEIEKLGLVEANDYPSGYYIYNPEVKKVSLQITDDTKYIFTDYNQLYTKDENGERLYETTKLNEFLKGSSYHDIPLEEQRIPYFLEVYDGKVISITEEFIYTQ